MTPLESCSHCRWWQSSYHHFGRCMNKNSGWYLEYTKAEFKCKNGFEVKIWSKSQAVSTNANISTATNVTQRKHIFAGIRGNGSTPRYEYVRTPPQINTPGATLHTYTSIWHRIPLKPWWRLVLYGSRMVWYSSCYTRGWVFHTGKNELDRISRRRAVMLIWISNQSMITSWQMGVNMAL